MYNNYDTMLKQLELEIEKLEAHFKSEEKRISADIEHLKYSQKQVHQAAADSKNTRAPEKTNQKLAEKKSDSLVDDIDKQLGDFYGSIELRDALKESQKRMDAVVDVLNRLKEYVRSQFVRLEIAHLLQNIETLRKVFLRMLDRMEIPDSDEFFNDSFSEASATTLTTNDSSEINQKQNVSALGQSKAAK